MINKTKYLYKTPDLCEMLNTTRFSLMRWEKAGKFTPPRNRHNDRVFTEEQLEEIKEAFEPGGCGYWHFKAASSGSL